MRLEPAKYAGKKAKSKKKPAFAKLANAIEKSMSGRRVLLELERLSFPSNFFEMVYLTVSQVPKGKVTTYSAIAKFLGNPRGSRAVGWGMRACQYSNVPCHRVVRADGRVSGNPEDARARIAKLRKEGIEVRRARVEVAKHFFCNFKNVRS